MYRLIPTMPPASSAGNPPCNSPWQGRCIVVLLRPDGDTVVLWQWFLVVEPHWVSYSPGDLARAKRSLWVEMEALHPFTLYWPQQEKSSARSMKTSLLSVQGTVGGASKTPFQCTKSSLHDKISSIASSDQITRYLSIQLERWPPQSHVVT